MPEYRKDIILDEWVIIAKERAKRPEIFKEENVKIDKTSDFVCPFDAGNEEMTPPEILRINMQGIPLKNSDPNWQIRVVPNKFPVLKPLMSPGTRIYGLYNIMDGFGLHEVIINSPKHITNLAYLKNRELLLIIDTYSKRLRDIGKDKRIESVIIMLNQGKEAGASLEHTHSQIFALPFISPILEKELQGSLKYYKKNKKCVFCDIINFELTENKRIVYQNNNFVVLHPFASRNPFESWIIPKKHYPNFGNITPEEISSFIECFKKTIDFFHNELNNPAFNYYIHTGPLRINADKYYHWHFELVPKLSIKAGFEIATGTDICITTPEDTAHFMKEAFR